MELAAGAMRPLLCKLGDLLMGEYSLEKRVRKGVKSLEVELMFMYSALCKVGEVPSSELDEQVRIWAGKVRDLSYDMEDAVDAFMMSVEEKQICDKNSEQTSTCKKRFRKVLKKATRLFSKGKALHQIVGDIEEAQRLAKELSDLRQRYCLQEMHNNERFAIDPRLMAMYKDATELVGIEDTRDKLVQMLAAAPVDERQLLKVISIVGFGGLGKTTLARAVYERIKVQFDCGAFVSMSQNPDITKIFKKMLHQLDCHRYKDINEAIRDEAQLIDEIRLLLDNKRYFIVIDDLWDTKTWEIVSCAFKGNNGGSRIIITTRNLEVATRAGEVYKLQQLSRDNSEKLFFRRLLADKGNEFQYDQLAVAVESEKILQKCAGVPLAIITIASLLAGKPREDWSNIYNSIGFGDGDNEDVENTRKILLFSYYDLPCYLRTCLLHLSIYPEDYLIRKDTLIWKWVAEGFVHEKPRIRLFEVGERYFNELINRTLIQPIETPHQGVIIGCRVHDMVLDMICQMSKEENFVTILDNNSENHISFSQSNVRRVALQKKSLIGKHDTLCSTSGMQKLRSFNSFMCNIDMLRSFTSFRPLRVLVLEDCTFMEDGPGHLGHLGMLHQLRYLGLRNTPVSVLPKEVGDLKFLQTLQLSRTRIKELPESVGRLEQLKCLASDSPSMRLPNSMGSLTSLEELRLSYTSLPLNFLKDLGKLSELRLLTLWVSIGDEGCNIALLESLMNLKKLHVLELSDDNASWEGYLPSRQLHRLHLVTCFSRLPAWVNSFSLPNLSHLHIYMKDLEARDLETLGRLPELLTLVLRRPIDCYSPVVIDGGALFSKLRCFGTDVPLIFLPGAMPRLEYVYFEIDALALKDANIGFNFSTLGNLNLLQEVSVYFRHFDWTEADTEAKEAFRRAVETHPNSPTAT